MTLRQELVADRVANLVASIGIPQDQAFERFVHSLVTGQSVHSFNAADWVDGAQDKQIDLISIEEGDDETEIFIISAKYTPTFSSNAIILMRNGLDWLHNRTRADVGTISNAAFRQKILDVRSVVSGTGPSNIRIHCYFATNGLPLPFRTSMCKKSGACWQSTPRGPSPSSPSNPSGPTSWSI